MQNDFNKKPSDNSLNSWHKNIVKTIEKDVERVKKNFQLRVNAKNEVTCKTSDVSHLNLKEFDKDEL